MGKPTALLSIGLLICGTMLGCGGEEKKRDKVEDFVKGTRKVIERLRKRLPQRDGYSIVDGVERVNNVLEGLPVLLERGKDKISRWEDRKKHAEEAQKFFLDNIKYKLLVDDERINIRLVNYDEDEIKGLLDELLTYIDKVENP